MWQALGEEYTVEEVSVAGLPGHFYGITSGNFANTLVWIDDEAGITFMLEAFLEKDTLLRMAESLRPGKTEPAFGEYGLSWIPEGYALYRTQGSSQTGSSHYRSDDRIAFEYTITDVPALPEVPADGTPVQVGDLEGIFYTMDGENFLHWLDPASGAVFTLSSSEDMDTMLEIADGVFWQE